MVCGGGFLRRPRFTVHRLRFFAVAKLGPGRGTDDGVAGAVDEESSRETHPPAGADVHRQYGGDAPLGAFVHFDAGRVRVQMQGEIRLLPHETKQAAGIEFSLRNRLIAGGPILLDQPGLGPDRAGTSCGRRRARTPTGGSQNLCARVSAEHRPVLNEDDRRPISGGCHRGGASGEPLRRRLPRRLPAWIRSGSTRRV